MNKDILKKIHKYSSLVEDKTLENLFKKYKNR